MNYIITNSCDKGCPYCFASTVRKNDPESYMSLDVFESFIDKSSTQVKLLGGEPTQHPHFKEIIDLLIKKKKNITLISNFLFDDDILQILLKAHEKIDIHYLINATDLDKLNRIELWSKNYNTLYSYLYNIDRELNLSVGLTIHKDLKYHINYLDFLNDNVIALENLRLSINFPSKKSEKNKFSIINNKEIGTTILALVGRSLRLGISPNIDCILFPCMFNNKEEFKYVNKFTKGFKTKCGIEGAPSDIFLDGTMSYCYPIKEYIKVDTEKYNTMEEAADDILIRYKTVRSQVTAPEECNSCKFFDNMCDGPCLAYYNLEGISSGINV